MAERKSAEQQADWLLRGKVAMGKPRHGNKGDNLIHSKRQRDHVHSALTQFARWCHEQHRCRANQSTPEMRAAWLEQRRHEVRQAHLSHLRHALVIAFGEKSAPSRVRSTIKDATRLQRTGRFYTREQLDAIARCQTPKNALATEIVKEAGLRAHELLTLQRVGEKAPSPYRTWSAERFAGRDGVRYVVTGKNGLAREVMMPAALSERLEALRLAEPRERIDRKVLYTQHYDLGGGNAWSVSFSSASKRALGWSSGGHGGRHAYVAERDRELANRMPREQANRIVAEEMGHFRPEITEVYRGGKARAA